MSNGQSIRSINILLIEDNPADVEIVRRALQNGNVPHKLKVINDGEEALKFLLELESASSQKEILQPQLIILDLNLPEVTGFEILKAVRFNSKINIVPVIMLTTSDEDADIEKSYRLGANSFITKPTGPEELTRLVSEIEKFRANIVKLP